MSANKTSQFGIDFIKKLEGGLRLTAYPDADGYSIGYGHYGVSKGTVITEAQADAYLVQDIAKVEMELNKYGFKLNQNQYDSLVSLFYNIGIGRITNFSSLLLANPEDEAITVKMNKYIYSQGSVNGYLVKRRAAEVELYKKKVL